MTGCIRHQTSHTCKLFDLFIGTTGTGVLCDLVNDILCILEHLRLLRRHSHIRNGYCHSCTGRIFITHCLDSVKNLSSLGSSVSIDDFFKDLFQLFFTYQEINFRKKFIARNTSVYISKILRNDLVEQETSKCRFYSSCQFASIRHCFCAAHMDSGL